jgi:hypothetical protein
VFFPSQVDQAELSSRFQALWLNLHDPAENFFRSFDGTQHFAVKTEEEDAFPSPAPLRRVSLHVFDGLFEDCRRIGLISSDTQPSHGSRGTGFARKRPTPRESSHS